MRIMVFYNPKDPCLSLQALVHRLANLALRCAKLHKSQSSQRSCQLISLCMGHLCAWHLLMPLCSIILPRLPVNQSLASCKPLPASHVLTPGSRTVPRLFVLSRTLIARAAEAAPRLPAAKMRNSCSN